MYYLVTNEHLISFFTSYFTQYPPFDQLIDDSSCCRNMDIADSRYIRFPYEGISEQGINQVDSIEFQI